MHSKSDNEDCWNNRIDYFRFESTLAILVLTRDVVCDVGKDYVNLCVMKFQPSSLVALVKQNRLSFYFHSKSITVVLFS